MSLAIDNAAEVFCLVTFGDMVELTLNVACSADSDDDDDAGDAAADDDADGANDADDAADDDAWVVLVGVDLSLSLLAFIRAAVVTVVTLPAAEVTGSDVGASVYVHRII